MTAAERLAAFAAGLRGRALPGNVAHAATRHLIDAAGCGLAGAAEPAVAPVAEAVRNWAGAREASVLGHDFRAPAPWAGLVNGTFAHALDFDDTHLESVVHPSAVVLPAALAVAEEAEATGGDLLTAAVAGYEVMTRIGAAAAGRFHARGLHPTGLCGPFGSAIAAGILWGLSPAELSRALGIAASGSSGLFAFLADGSDTKRLHAGWAAATGIVAADLARRGFTGPATVFEGPHGFFDSFLAGEEPDLARLTRDLGTVWETGHIAIKPYPACHFVHAAMDAAAASGVGWGDVEEIVCTVPPPVVGIVCEPREDRIHPANPYAARFSLPFAVAAAMVGDRGGLEMFGEEALADRRILTLAERVYHVVDDSLPFPRSYGTRITVHTRGGRTVEREELTNRGHPDRPLTDAEVSEKFLSNASRRLDEPRAAKLLDTLWSLESLDSLEPLLSLARIP